MARSKTSGDPWHYPRPELAAKYLRIFDVGLTSACALFAKRRMGKSEFLEQDLMPAAREAQYLTVYLNLWDARSQPAPALLSALTRALQPTGFGKLARSLKRPLKNVKASAKLAGIAEGSLEAELGSADAAAAPHLTELIRGFDKPNGRTDTATSACASRHNEYDIVCKLRITLGVILRRYQLVLIAHGAITRESPRGLRAGVNTRVRRA